MSINEINENAHSKIMKEMIKFLDDCKKEKTNCQCSGTLEYDPKEKDEFKKWKFIYQCDSNEEKNKIMKKTTIDFIKNIPNYNEEIYNVKK